MYAKQVDGIWRWVTYGRDGLLLGNQIGWLFLEMVEAAWGDLPSDYTPTPLA